MIREFAHILTYARHTRLAHDRRLPIWRRLYSAMLAQIYIMFYPGPLGWMLIGIFAILCLMSMSLAPMILLVIILGASMVMAISQELGWTDAVLNSIANLTHRIWSVMPSVPTPSISLSEASTHQYGGLMIFSVAMIGWWVRILCPPAHLANASLIDSAVCLIFAMFIGWLLNFHGHKQEQSSSD